MKLDKTNALKKVEIAIDKIIDLEDYVKLESIAEPRARALDQLRQLLNRLGGGR